MPHIPDISDDHEFLDGTETVTVTQAGTMTQQTVADTLRRPVTLREIEASGGAYVRGDMKFSLPEAALSFEPAAGDTISDAAAQDWNIQEVEMLAVC